MNRSSIKKAQLLVLSTSAGMVLQCVPNDTENVTLFLQTLLHLLHTVCYICNIGSVINVTSGVLQVSHKARRRCVAPHSVQVLHGVCTQR